MPAHITLVFPFVPAVQIDQLVLASLTEVIEKVGAFEFALYKLNR